jgi:hypothetical protein
MQAVAPYNIRAQFNSFSPLQAKFRAFYFPTNYSKFFIIHTFYPHIVYHAEIVSLSMSTCGFIGKRNEDAWGSGCTDPCFLDLGTSWR